MTTSLAYNDMTYPEPPPLPSPKMVAQIKMFAAVQRILATSTLSNAETDALAADIFEELTDSNYKPTRHYGVSLSRRGCTGPLCARAAADRTRYFKRRQMAELGYPPSLDVGGRRPNVTEKSRLVTQIAVLLTLHKAETAPQALIEACLIDRVGLPNTAIYTDAFANWAAENSNVTYREPLYDGLPAF